MRGKKGGFSTREEAGVGGRAMLWAQLWCLTAPEGKSNFGKAVTEKRTKKPTNPGENSYFYLIPLDSGKQDFLGTFCAQAALYQR